MVRIVLLLPAYERTVFLWLARTSGRSSGMSDVWLAVSRDKRFFDVAPRGNVCVGRRIDSVCDRIEAMPITKLRVAEMASNLVVRCSAAVASVTSKSSLLPCYKPLKTKHFRASPCDRENWLKRGAD
ncbi:MAG: hypothetical protein ACOH2N_00675 [Devosia sp.]